MTSQSRHLWVVEERAQHHGKWGPWKPTAFVGHTEERAQELEADEAPHLLQTEQLQICKYTPEEDRR